MASLIRRAASRFVPLAIRASVGTTQRCLHHQSSSALFTAAVTNCSRRSFPLFNHSFCSKSSSDASLLAVLESEIKDGIASMEDLEEEQAPAGFPFKIEDIPGHQTITLTRELQGETISVAVNVPNVGGQDDENEDDDEGVPNSDCLPLVVTVSKEGGPSLKFDCIAYADEVVIDRMSIKDPEAAEDLVYDGPDFNDLDENLQNAFHKYLEIRGIKPSVTNYLFGYMVEKDSKEYVTWLTNIKKFIEA